MPPPRCPTSGHFLAPAFVVQHEGGNSGNSASARPIDAIDRAVGWWPPASGSTTRRRGCLSCRSRAAADVVRSGSSPAGGSASAIRRGSSARCRQKNSALILAPRGLLSICTAGWRSAPVRAVSSSNARSPSRQRSTSSSSNSLDVAMVAPRCPDHAFTYGIRSVSDRSPARGRGPPRPLPRSKAPVSGPRCPHNRPAARLPR